MYNFNHHDFDNHNYHNQYNRNINNNNNNNARLDRRNYNEETELQRALRLSAESFAIEQKKRKEEEAKEQAKYLLLLKKKELEEKAKREKEEKEKNDPRYVGCKNIEMFLNNMNWAQMFINRRVGAGLQNLGNSCFLNATLQCLAYTAPLAQILQSHTYSSTCPPSKKFCALYELETFIPSMLLNGRKIHQPINLFRNLGKINDLLTPGCQEDAHEFLQSLLDKMEMAYDDAYFYKHNKNKLFKRDPYNPIRRLFEGTTKTTVMCSKCRSVTSTEEPFSCVSLDVDSDVTLTESFSIFTQDELMRGNEKYYCENCKRKVIARKQLTLAKLPPNLIFHFKRFKLNSYSNHQRELSMTKLCDHIEFPSEINFNEIMDMIIHPSHQHEVKNDPNYELYGIVVHSGPKLGYGHYYAFVKSFDGKQWFRMNDMEVLPVDFKKVLKEQAYLLFYRRKTHNSLLNEMNQLKVEMMMQKNKQNNNNNNNNDTNLSIDNNDSNDSTNNTPKYKWQNENTSPTQVRSTPTQMDEKVDVNFLNDTYFERSCGDNDTTDNNGFVKVEKSSLKADDNDIDSGNGNDDRSKFVMIPPMTTRSDVSTFESTDSDKDEGSPQLSSINKTEKDIKRRAKLANNAFEEVYWPGQLDEDEAMRLID